MQFSFILNGNHIICRQIFVDKHFCRQNLVDEFWSTIFGRQSFCRIGILSTDSWPKLFCRQIFVEKQEHEYTFFVYFLEFALEKVDNHREIHSVLCNCPCHQCEQNLCKTNYDISNILLCHDLCSACRYIHRREVVGFRSLWYYIRD